MSGMRDGVYVAERGGNRQGHVRIARRLAERPISYRSKLRASARTDPWR